MRKFKKMKVDSSKNFSENNLIITFNFFIEKKVYKNNLTMFLSDMPNN